MRAHTAAGGENAFGRDHAAQIFGRGFDADEQNFFTLLGGDHRAISVEIDLAGGGAGAGGKTGGDGLGLLDFGQVKNRGEQLFELVGRIAEDGGFGVNELLLDHVDGELQRGGGGALAVTRLEHEQAAFLDGEFDVLHILEMFFQGLADGQQLGVALGHDVLELEHGLGRTDAGDDVFALGVDEEFAVEFVRAVGRVTGERHAGTGVVAGVAEHHGLDVDGGSPFRRNIVFAAIDDRAVVHPGAEHGTGRAAELVPRIVRKHLAGAFLDQGLEAHDEFLLVIGGELGVFDVRVILLVLEGVNDGFERFVIFAFALLHAEDDVAVHLDEAAVAIPREAGILGGVFEREHRLVIQTEVQNRVHHAGHGIAGAGTDGDQERKALRVTELVAHDLLHVGNAGLHLRLEFLGIGLLVGVEISADFGGDGETGRHGQANAGHFREVGTLAAEQRFH